MTSPAQEQVLRGFAEIAVTDRVWASFEEADANRITAVGDGSPLFVNIRSARPLGDLALPADPYGRYTFSPYPHLYLHVGDDTSLRSLSTCYITLAPEDLDRRELVLPLAPMVHRPGGNPTDCWLAAAVSSRPGARTYEIRLAGLAARTQNWLPVSDLLAVEQVEADYNSGTAQYAAMLALPPEQTAPQAASAPPREAPAPLRNLQAQPRNVQAPSRDVQAPPRASQATGQVPARIVIHHNDGDPAAVARANNVREILAARPGFNVEVRPVSAFVSTDNIRIFFEADRDKAYAARELVAADTVPIRDFTDHRPLPRPGTIELWLAPKEDGRTSTKR